MINRTLRRVEVKHALQVRCFSTGDNKIPEGIQKGLNLIKDKVLDYLMFRKDATSYLNYPTDGPNNRKAYRTPSPASQPPPNIPKSMSIEEVYSTQKYIKDAPEKTIEVESGDKVYILEQTNLEGSSKGNKNPDVLRYDASGTRSAMTTTNEAMLAEQMKHRADHLPKAWWLDTDETLEEEARRKNIPFLLGRDAPWMRKIGIYEYEQEKDKKQSVA